MALREVHEDGARRVYEGELNKHWTIGPKVHGGAMVALCANAARTAHGGPVEPVAVSASFLSAPDPGPMRLVTSMRKRGRRISVVDVELIQGERAAVHAVITLGEPEHLVPPLLSANPAVGLMDPEPPAEIAAVEPGHRLRGLVNLAEGCDIRTLDSTLGLSTDGKPPVITDVERRQARADLAYWHATIVVLSDGGDGSRWTGNRGALLDTATALFGTPQRVEDVWLWRVSEIPPV